MAYARRFGRNDLLELEAAIGYGFSSGCRLPVIFNEVKIVLAKEDNSLEFARHHAETIFFRSTKTEGRNVSQCTARGCEVTLM